MFLNLILPGQKTWKPYWVEIREDGFLDISSEYGREAFTSFHIGVLKVRPSKEYPDRPDVLEFYDGDGFTQVHFYVFTYDPFDIIEFFKGISATYKQWRDKVSNSPTPLTFQCDIKPPGFFSGLVTWKVEANRSVITKGGKVESVIQLSQLQNITPCANSSKANTFKYTLKNGGDNSEHRCQSLENMKKLLDAIYTNAYILKSQSEPAPASA